MNTSNDAIKQAIKLMGAFDPEAAKKMKTLETVSALSQEGPTPDILLSLLGQLNPKYAPYVTMLKTMSKMQENSQKQTETPPVQEEPRQDEPFVQYNHPDQ